MSFTPSRATPSRYVTPFLAYGGSLHHPIHSQRDFEGKLIGVGREHVEYGACGLRGGTEMRFEREAITETIFGGLVPLYTPSANFFKNDRYRLMLLNRLPSPPPLLLFKTLTHTGEFYLAAFTPRPPSPPDYHLRPDQSPPASLTRSRNSSTRR